MIKIRLYIEIMSVAFVILLSTPSASAFFTTMLDFEDQNLPTEGPNEWQQWLTFNGTAQTVNINGPSNVGDWAIDVAGTDEIGWAFDLDGKVSLDSGWSLQADIRAIYNSDSQGNTGVAQLGRTGLGNGTSVPSHVFTFDTWKTLQFLKLPHSTDIDAFIDGTLVRTLPAHDYANRSRFNESDNWISFGIANNGHSFRTQFDNIQFMELPEPGTCILLTTGAIAAIRRRQ